MKREVIVTSDGSTTIHLPELNEQYHSKHGAIQEAKHVFIKNGLAILPQPTISILEIGFGTGLNCLVTYLSTNKKISYTGVEAYPVAYKELLKLNYCEQLEEDRAQDFFDKIHNTSWEETHLITSNFELTKRKQFFVDINDTDTFDIIYFDAFGARVQPELWTEEIFQIMFRALHQGGVLVTYAAKGSVRRAMQAVGFEVERLEGPPGKREMLRGKKV